MAIHDLIYLFASSFIALFPVINPIGNVFIINSYLQGVDNTYRKSIIKKIIANSLLIAVGSLVAGHFILLLFGLAIPVIQVGGGIIICKTGWEWLSKPETNNSDDPQKAADKISIKKIEGLLFYPLSFPIVIGPGTISIIFTLMANASIKNNILYTWIDYTIIAFAIFSIMVILYLFLSQSPKITKKLGASGNLIINKLIAFITFCIGIQIMLTGISKIFHLNIL